MQTVNIRYLCLNFEFTGRYLHTFFPLPTHFPLLFHSYSQFNFFSITNVINKSLLSFHPHKATEIRNLTIKNKSNIHGCKRSREKKKKLYIYQCPFQCAKNSLLSNFKLTPANIYPTGEESIKFPKKGAPIAATATELLYIVPTACQKPRTQHTSTAEASANERVHTHPCAWARYKCTSCSRASSVVVFASIQTSE